ncbi:unnamed protein product [Phytomonas sp. Hart1]|nr:unnamed protein product [Phytomonas sp. Hart1]|eukprot:CCW71363.1 unnamed protein product [Phytomonas sp. isolate Hart1]
MYHLHIVDNVGSVLGSLLFAHFTLRCGNLRKFILLSASAVPVHLARFNLHNSRGDSNLSLRYSGEPGEAENSPNHSTLGVATLGNPVHTILETENEPDENNNARVLQIAAAILRGDWPPSGSSDKEDRVVESLPWLCPLEKRNNAIRRYPFFQSPFAKAELSLSRLHGARLHELEAPKDIAPYFHFILAVQPSTYDYLCDYYRDRHSSHSSTGFPLSRSVIFCVGGGNDDITRTIFIAQKFVEGLVGAGGAVENSINAGSDSEDEGELEENDKNDCEEWVERVDGTLQALSFQYGAEIFLMII